MGTLCENCPIKNRKLENGETCMAAFAKEFSNSCVNFDVAELKLKENRDKFDKEIESFSQEKVKKAKTKVTEKKVSSTRSKKNAIKKKTESNELEAEKAVCETLDFV